jgi:hypothetical protein
MSDHKDHQDEHGHGDHHGAGAHEVDKMPSSRLFNLLFGLSALTLVACIGVVQLFYRQVDTIRDTRDAKVSFQLAEYRQEMDALKGGFAIDMIDDDGVPEAEGGRGVHEVRRFQMPLADARKRVLEQPQQLLKASRPYRGWRNPDANAPKAVAPTGPMPRGPRPAVPAGVDGARVVPANPALVPGRPEAPAVPAEGRAPDARVAPAAPAEGKADAAKVE